VLARKWRPARFDEVAGQAHVTTALRNAIRSGRIPHAVLLTGPRGVGKTTLARLLARSLNCEKGPTDEPCGTCVFCREIAAGTSTDVQEIDAASRTGVDDVREIIEAVRYAPTPGKWRIFVVDEVHMLSPAAFNALLKTLEEPPPRSLFVFATTNPERIPFTVVSRCQRYDLRRLGASEVAARLREVAAAEGLHLSDAGMLAVARAGEGSLRDALTLLDQVVAVAGATVSDAEVVQILDLIDPEVVLGILRACVERDPGAALAACARAAEAGVDAKRLGASLVQRLRDLVVLGVAPDRAGLVEASETELAELRALAARAEPARVRRMFRALVREQEDLAWAPEPFAVLEMALVRLATLPSGDEVGELLARLDALERRLGGGGGEPGPGDGPARGAGGSGRRAASPGAPRRAGEAGATPPATHAGPRLGPAGLDAAGRRESPPRPEAAPAPEHRSRFAEQEPGLPGAPGLVGPVPDLPGHGPAPAPPEAGLADEGGLADGGPAEAFDAPGAPPLDAPGAPPLGTPAAAGRPAPETIFDRLRVFAQRENRALFAALEGGRLGGWDGERLRLAIPDGIAARRLRERRSDLAAVCERFFGRPLRVELDVEAGAVGAAPRGRDDARAASRRQEALRHPAVNAALEILDGEIVEIRALGDAS